MLRALEGLEQDGVTLGPATADASGDVGCIAWTILAPTHGQVSGAQARRSPNYSSAVVRLDVGGRRILVAGDADGFAWRRLLTTRPESVVADAFRLPHHGDFYEGSATNASTPEILNAVGADFHIVSVGTANSHGHPEGATLAELAQSTRSSRVFCTEVNAKCLAGQPIPHEIASASLPSGSLVGASRPPHSCPCAGTVRVDITADSWIWSPSIEEHGRVLNSLGRPACRA